MATASMEAVRTLFTELAKEIDSSFGFVDELIEGRTFWVLAKNGETMYRSGRRIADQLFRIELLETVVKVSALVRNMDEWKHKIGLLEEPGFNILARKTLAHKGRTTFTGLPEAFQHHRVFLSQFLRACVES